MHAIACLPLVTELQRQALDALDKGAGWGPVSIWFCKVMRKVNQRAVGFAGKPGDPEPPHRRI